MKKQYQNKEIYEMVIEDVKGLLVKQLLAILSDRKLGLTVKLRYQVQFEHELPVILK